MRLRILGCSGTYPTPGHPSSGFLIEDADTSVWIDAGTGTFAALQEAMDFTELNALIITHVHADHCLDIFPFYYALRFCRGGASIPVYCPEGAREHLSDFLCGDYFTLSDVFEFQLVRDGDVIQIGDLKISFKQTNHPIETLAVRAESGGKRITYSSDTGPHIDFSKFAADSDLFLCEATYQNSLPQLPLHLTAEQAGEFAKQCEAKKLLITHIWPTLEKEVSLMEAKAVSDCPAEIALPGAVYDV